MNFTIRKSKAFTIPILTTATKFSLTREISTFFNNRIVKGIEIPNINEVSMDWNGADLIADADFKKAFLSINNRNGQELISYQPLTTFNAADNDGQIAEVELYDINFTDSYITFGTAPSGAAQVIIVFYWDETF